MTRNFVFFLGGFLVPVTVASCSAALITGVAGFAACRVI